MSVWNDCAYQVCRHVAVGPALRVWGRLRIIGRHHVPKHGPVILAANHLAVVDSFYLALAARRPVSFLAKHEYFDRPGLLGRLQRWFFSAVGQIPVNRQGGAAASPALAAASRIIQSGGAWGIHPEGTRSPDGQLHRGRTGAVRVVAATGAQVIPVAITGTRRADVGRRGQRVVVEFLGPLDMTVFIDAGHVDVRAATDALMHAIGSRSGQTYVDTYAVPTVRRPPSTTAS